MHTQKKPSKYTAHASKCKKITQKNKDKNKDKNKNKKHIRIRRLCIKCALCTSVFTITLLADAQWHIIKPQFDLYGLKRHSEKTMAQLSAPQQSVNANQTSPANAARKDSSKTDDTLPSQEKDNRSKHLVPSDLDSSNPGQKKESGANRKAQSSDKDTAKQQQMKNTDEQTFYTVNKETDHESYYSYADNQLQFSAESDSSIPSAPEPFTSGPLIDAAAGDDETTQFTYVSGDWNLILVNPWNKLPDDYEISLTPLPNGHSIDSRCYPSLTTMMNDCRKACLQPLICSSYRSQEKQESLFQERIDELRAQGYSKKDAKAKAATSVARPGTSEHQLGLAVDIVDKSHQTLDAAQEDTPVQQWLLENSWKYGFILRYPNQKSNLTGIIYEPWHYRYVGQAAAQEIHERGICLEEYLEDLS